MYLQCLVTDSHVFSCIAAPDDFSERTSMMLELEQSTRNVSVNISITDDTLAEGTETFHVSINIVMDTDLSNVTVNPNMTTVSIQDNDCKLTLSLYSPYSVIII